MTAIARRPWLAPDVRVGDLRILAPAFDADGERFHLATTPDGTAVSLEVIDWDTAELAREATRAVEPLVGRALEGVVPLLAAGHVGPRSWRALEAFGGGSMLPPRGVLPSAERLRVARAVTRALVGLHAVDVVHGDLRPACIVRDRSAAPRIFGAARLAPARIGLGPQRSGPSPEQSMGRPPTAASDVHALGMVLYRLVAGRDPFGVGSVDLDPTLALAITSAPAMHALTPADQQLVTLARRLLRKAPADRPSAREALHVIEGIDRGAAPVGGRRARMVGRATQPMPTFDDEGETIAVRGPLPPAVRDDLIEAGFAVRPAALALDAPLVIALETDRATLAELVRRHPAVVTDAATDDVAELADLIRMGLAGVVTRPLDPTQVRRAVVRALRSVQRGAEGD